MAWCSALDDGGVSLPGQLLARRNPGQLLVQILPLAHAQVGQEVLLAPAAQRALTRGCLLARGPPEVQDRDEIGTLVREQGVPLVRRLDLVGWPLARILDAEERRDDQCLGQAAQTGRLEQDSREPWVDRQLCHLPTEARDPAIAIHGAQFLQQAVAIVQQARVRRIEKREILGRAEPERRHLQDQAREVGAQDLRIRVLGAPRKSSSPYRRMQMPSPTRPQRPLRCAALARDTGSIGRRWNLARGL